MITKKWWRRAGTTLACCLLLLPASFAQAENRALIVGVGDYKYSDVRDIPGIDLDIKMMEDVADLMGFNSHQIKVLRDSQATSEEIEYSIRTWLGGANANDKVLFYYSGHGSAIPDRSRDEDDGLDEVLLGYDTRVVQENNTATLEGVVVDDTINNLLNNLRSKNVLAVIDSCHSGTNAKSLNFRSTELYFERYESKLYEYPGMVHSKSVHVTPQNNDKEKYVHIGACRDDQESAASTHGSIFTLGISEAVKNAAGQGTSITPRELQKKSTAFIQAKADSSSKIWEFHPQINGNSRLMDKSISMRPVNNGNGPGWKKLEQLYRHIPDKSLDISVRETYRIGDHMEVKLDIPRSGYLCLLFVDAADEITIVFPNKYNQDGWVEPGKMLIPDYSMAFDLTIARPAGKHKLVALWSKKRMNVFENGKKSINADLAIATEKSLNILTRGIEANSRYSVGQAEFNVR